MTPVSPSTSRPMAQAPDPTPAEPAAAPGADAHPRTLSPGRPRESRVLMMSSSSPAPPWEARASLRAPAAAVQAGAYQRAGTPLGVRGAAAAGARPAPAMALSPSSSRLQTPPMAPSPSSPKLPQRDDDIRARCASPPAQRSYRPSRPAEQAGGRIRSSLDSARYMKTNEVVGRLARASQASARQAPQVRCEPYGPSMSQSMSRKASKMTL